MILAELVEEYLHLFGFTKSVHRGHPAGVYDELKQAVDQSVQMAMGDVTGLFGEADPRSGFEVHIETVYDSVQHSLVSEVLVNPIGDSEPFGQTLVALLELGFLYKADESCYQTTLVVGLS